MTKIAIAICSSFCLFAAEGPVTPEVSEDFSHPLRRAPAGYPGIDTYHLEHGTLSEKLIVMVTGSFLDDVYVPENKIVELIRANPGKSNPYSGAYEAYLIALASRHGMKATVQAIVESNPGSLNCLSSGLTPLTEALEFRQDAVSEYLRGVGARQHCRSAFHSGPLE